MRDGRREERGLTCCADWFTAGRRQRDARGADDVSCLTAELVRLDSPARFRRSTPFSSISCGALGFRVDGLGVLHSIHRNAALAAKRWRGMMMLQC